VRFDECKLLSSRPVLTYRGTAGCRIEEPIYEIASSISGSHRSPRSAYSMLPSSRCHLHAFKLNEDSIQCRRFAHDIAAVLLNAVPRQTVGQHYPIQKTIKIMMATKINSTV
jgi:hypothetical protein